MNVLITGGAGFLGAWVVRKYKENGDRVVILDDFSGGRTENIPLNVPVIRGDVLDYGLLDGILKLYDIDIVNHLAADVRVMHGMIDPMVNATINIHGTINVLEAARKNGVKKVIYASSGAVYGESQSDLETEEHPLEPQWQYGVSKLAGEQYCQQYYRLYGLPTVSLRYSIIYGPWEWYGRVLTQFLKRVIIEEKPPVVFGDGRQVRDFIYVEDAAEANIAATLKHARGEVFNISSGVGVEIQDLARLVADLSPEPMEIIYDDTSEGRLPGELRTLIMDNAKAVDELDWYPSRTLKVGLLEEVKWLRANPAFWGKPAKP